jgi:hypothetical protein
MNAVLAEIKKGQHPLMMDYVEFAFDTKLVNGQWIRENSISPSHYTPSNVEYDENGRQIRDGWICTQGFWEFTTTDVFEKHYMRMVRCGKQNYLSYSQLAENMISTLDDIEYFCSICETEFKGKGYTCVGKRCQCSMGENVCLSCYETTKTCRLCDGTLHPL